MKKYIAILPLIFLFIASSCSETDPEKETKSEEPVIKPLLEREPEVREYFEVLDELLEEYLVAAENFLDNHDKMETGDLDVMEKVTILSELSESFVNIMDLTEELSALEVKRTEIEGILNGDDIIEFGILFADKMVRYNELVKRIEETDFGNSTAMFDDLF